jgi:L-fucose isomerase
MARVGILTMSDGREGVHRDIEKFALGIEERIASALEESGHEVVRASGPVWTNALATREARRVADERPELTVFNYPVWAFPHFTMLAAKETPGPLLLFSSIDPGQPGMVGMLAAAGALDQIGRVYGRAWGEISDPTVRDRVEAYVRAAGATRSLQGSTFGRIGGRPMGMYTAVANADQWMDKFGVDVEEIDQWELVRRSEEVEESRVRRGRRWLEEHAAGVHYDGKKLTPELLERQIRSYYAMREGLAETPVLFADVRHYHAEHGIWDLCNSGQHATWFAARSEDPEENMRRVHLYPEVFFFPAGGASIHHLAAEGEFTFARLTRLNGRYRLHAMRGSFERYDEETNERLMGQSTREWPHAFARMEADADEVLSRYGSNHIHAIPGNHVEELRVVCKLLDVDYDGFGGA